MKKYIKILKLTLQKRKNIVLSKNILNKIFVHKMILSLKMKSNNIYNPMKLMKNIFQNLKY